MQPIRLGVVGAAEIAKRMVLPAVRMTPSIRLVAIASRDPEKAIGLAQENECDAINGYDELLKRDDIDAIYMPLPTGLHRDWAIAALEAGKHLLIEKSLATSLKEAGEIISIARRKKKLVMENYMFARHAQQVIVRQYIESGLGEIRLFRAFFGFPPLDATNFRYSHDLGGGALLDVGGYVLRALDVFFPGSEAAVRCARLEYGDHEVDIAGTATLDVDFAGRVFPAQLAFGFDHFYQCGVEVWGSNGQLKTTRTFTAGPTVTPMLEINSSRASQIISLPVDNHFIRTLEDFVGYISTGEYECEYERALLQAELQEQVRIRSFVG